MKTCNVEGCTRRYLAKGLCAFHYKRALFGRDLAKPPRHSILPKTHPVYVAWVNMKTRCDNSKSTQYKYYGGRGISYCLAWKDFINFHADMFESWQEGLLLDRIDTNGNYCKENCRWVDHFIQAQNRNPKGYLDVNS